MIGPITLGLLVAAIVAAFVKSALEQRARQLQRAARRGHPDEVPAADEAEADRIARMARAVPDQPESAAERVAARARLWRVLFYVLALGALAAAILGW